jgi:hypothetical protein
MKITSYITTALLRTVIFHFSIEYLSFSNFLPASDKNMHSCPVKLSPLAGQPLFNQHSSVYHHPCKHVSTVLPSKDQITDYTGQDLHYRKDGTS